MRDSWVIGLVAAWVATVGCGDDSEPADAGPGPDAAADARPPMDGAADDAGGGDAGERTDAGVPGHVPEDVYRACAFANACSFGPVVSAQLARCVDAFLMARIGMQSDWTPEDWQIATRLLECGQTATTCEEFVGCNTLGAPRCGPGTSSTCVGDVLIACGWSGDNVPHVVDCGELGMSCDGGCQPPDDAVSCDASALPPYSCDEDQIVWCAGAVGGEVRFDCPTGSTCVAQPGSVGCMAGVGDECASPSFGCDGDSIVGCLPVVDGHRTVRADCGAAGRVCDPTEGCVPAARECDRHAEPTCDGPDIVTCVEGVEVRLSCPAYGYEACERRTLGTLSLPFCAGIISPTEDAGVPADAGRGDAGPPMSDAGPPMSDAGPPMSDAGPPMSDAGPPMSDAGPPATCHPLENVAPVIPEMYVAAALPDFIGGAIPSGLYHRTRVEIHTGPGGASGPTGDSYRTTLRLAEDAALGAPPAPLWTISQRVGDTSIERYRGATRITAAGGDLAFDVTCPATTTGTFRYSVFPGAGPTPTRLQLLALGGSGRRLETYELQ